MRKPPDKPGSAAVPSLSEREVETSNATLNTLFGRSHQRSWMTGSMAPVRPTPRRTSTTLPLPSALLPPQPPNVISIQKTVIPVLPSPTPSDESSPDLARSALNGRSTSSNLEHLRPQHANESSPQLQHVRPTTSRPQIQFWTTAGSSGAIADEGIRQEYISEPQGGRLEALNHVRRQASGAYNGQNFTAEEREFTSELLQSPSPDIVSAGLLGFEITRDSASQFNSSNATQRTLPIVQSYHASQPPVQRDELQNQKQTHMLPLTSTTITTVFPPIDDQASVQNRWHAPAPPVSMRQRSETPTIPSLKPMVGLIDAYIASNGGEKNLNNGLERPRFQLLKDACSKEDGFYVAMHQLFCVWDIDKKQVTAISGFPPEDTLVMAFKIVGQLIRDNSQLLPAHRSWFSDFPGPLVHLLKSSESYRRTIQSVGVFLARLAVDWLLFAHDAQTRNYPPLVDELVKRLGILSPILQRIVFTATRRNLGVHDDATGNEMEEMFRKDQKEHQLLSARVDTDRPSTEREISERNRQLIIYYSRLLSQVPHQRRPLAQFPTSVSLPQQAISSPGMIPSIQRLQQPSTSLGSNFGAPASPDIAENGQFSTGGQSRRTFTDAPNTGIGVVTDYGRPASMVNSPQFPGSAILRSNDGPMQQNNLFPGGGQLHSLIQPNPADQIYRPPTHPQELINQLQVIERDLQQLAQVQQNSRSSDEPSFPQNMNPYEHTLLLQRASLRRDLSNWNQMANMPNPLHPQHPINPQYQQHARNPHTTQLSPSHSDVQNPPNLLVALPSGVVPSHRNPQSVQRMPTAGRRGPNPSPFNPDLGGARRISPIRQGSAFTPPQVLASPASYGAVWPQGPTAATPQVIQDLLQEYMRSPLLERTVIPPRVFIYHPHGPHPEMTTLHQAHLRSPKLLPQQKFPENMPPDNTNRRFYQVVKGFAHPPTPLSPTQAINTFEFSLSDSEFASIAQPQTVHDVSFPEIREFGIGTLQYRMRCIRRKPLDDAPDWVVEDTAWPENAAVQLSFGMQKHQMELRRKGHYGKDFPVDLTAYVRLIPPNSLIQITVSIPGRRKRLAEAGYFFAVEVIEILGHRQIMEGCQTQRKPIQETSDLISKSLIGLDVGDDDISLVSSEITLNVTDPFSSRVFDIPVRGKSCLHRECFDLETFLLSRNSKPNSQGQPCMVDVWKCPLCNKDARPSMLQVDEYFVNIRKKLKERNALDVKSIVVNIEGQWKPKRLPQTDNRKRKAAHNASDSDDDGIQERKRRQVKSTSIVIDLLDD